MRIGSRLKYVILGVCTNIALAACKLTAGLLGNSYALVADAVESMVDVIGSLVVYGGLKISGKAPTEDFPYGFGKAEALSAFTVGMLVMVAAVAIALEALSEISRPHAMPEVYTLYVLLAVVLIKETLYRILKRSSIPAEDLLLSADAFHHRADALTSLAAAIGISLALWGGAGWAAADDWAALFASLVIAYNGLAILRASAVHLLDKSAPQEIVELIRQTAHTIADVRNVEKLSVRQAGAGLFVDIHVQADPGLSLEAAHIIGGKVKTAIMRELPNVGGVLVHMEPYSTAA